MPETKLVVVAKVPHRRAVATIGEVATFLAHRAESLNRSVSSKHGECDAARARRAERSPFCFAWNMVIARRVDRWGMFARRSDKGSESQCPICSRDACWPQRPLCSHSSRTPRERSWHRKRVPAVRASKRVAHPRLADQADRPRPTVRRIWAINWRSRTASFVRPPASIRKWPRLLARAAPRLLFRRRARPAAIRTLFLNENRAGGLRRAPRAPLFLRRSIHIRARAPGPRTWILGLFLFVHLRRERPVVGRPGSVVVLASHLGRFARSQRGARERQAQRNRDRENSHGTLLLVPLLNRRTDRCSAARQRQFQPK